MRSIVVVLAFCCAFSASNARERAGSGPLTTRHSFYCEDDGQSFDFLAIDKGTITRADSLTVDSLIRYLDAKGFHNEEGIQAFRSFHHKYPLNAEVALYLGRAFLRQEVAVPPEERQAYLDSAEYYYKLADRQQPGICEQANHFSVSELLFHLYGARAMDFLEKKEYDKARAALKTARTSGWISDKCVELSRVMLDMCDSNGIIFPITDEDSFGIMYLQLVEHYRPDISHVNIVLTNYSWYNTLLLTSQVPGLRSVKMSLSDSALQALPLFTEVDQDSISVTTYPIDPTSRPALQKTYSDILEKPIHLADSVSFYFPVIEQIRGHTGYELSQIVLSSIIRGEQWQRKLYFPITTVEYLFRINVPLLCCVVVNELIPISDEECRLQKLDSIIFDYSKIRHVLLHDIDYSKFGIDSGCSQMGNAFETMVSFYLAKPTKDTASQVRLLQKILSIPITASRAPFLSHIAVYLYYYGKQKEGLAYLNKLLPSFSPQTTEEYSISDNALYYCEALLLCGRRKEAQRYAHFFPETAEHYANLQHVFDYYHCKLR